jgi:hypothetical protein
MSRKFDFLKAAKPRRSSRTQKPGSPEIQRAARPGRPAGKRTDPGLHPDKAYIRKGTHHAIKLRLLQEGQGREFSELVEELLAGWLKSK